jgi:hypothetical protein
MFAWVFVRRLITNAHSMGSLQDACAPNAEDDVGRAVRVKRLKPYLGLIKISSFNLFSCWLRRRIKMVRVSCTCVEGWI